MCKWSYLVYGAAGEAVVAVVTATLVVAGIGAAGRGRRRRSGSHRSGRWGRAAVARTNGGVGLGDHLAGVAWLSAVGLALFFCGGLGYTWFSRSKISFSMFVCGPWG